jgi:D-glycero-D-manno-heptose 1,7-bisphosphate phosphatase
MQRYKDALGSKVRFEYSVGRVEDDTGRRLLNAYNLLDEQFILLYGDNYWPIQLDDMIDLYAKTKTQVLTTIFSNKNGTGEYGWENNVEVGVNNYVKRYDKHRKSFGLNGVDIGYFLVSKRALNPSLKGNLSFESNFLPELITKQQLAAYVTDIQYYFITTLETLGRFETYVRENKIGHVRLNCT